MSVPREKTQERMDRLSAGTLRHTLSQRYTVADRIEERAISDADRPFLFYEDRVVTYADFNAAANRVAHAALAAGLSCGDNAGLMMENRPEFIIAWAGLAKIGVTAALINTHVTGKPLVHALAATEVRVVIVGGECLERFLASGDDAAEGRDILVWPDGDCDASLETLPAGIRDFSTVLAEMPESNVDADSRGALTAGDDLFLIFTSGTTGLPKAARISQMRFLGVGDGMSDIAGYGPDDVVGCVLPLYHGAAGMVVVSSALACGAAIAIARRFSASGFWDFARRYDVTAWQYIGETCRYLLNQPPRDDDRDHSVRVMMGAGLGADIWERFQERFGIDRILEGWSSTEANTNLINLDNRVGSCGRIPFKDRHNGRLIRFDVQTETHPRDEAGFCIECEPGEVGEFVGMILELPDSGAGRFEGYASESETEAKILRGVFSEGDRWYRSGDLLREDEDGYFYFVDRIGDTFRWKSENVSTQEVAEALAEFPGVEIANVYGVKIAGADGRAGMAALVLRDRAAFDEKAFFEFTEERLPGYAAPVFVRLAGEADMTTTFKLRKVDLQREGYDSAKVADPLYVRDGAAGAYVPYVSGDPIPGV
jgi:fatty-acyl-CoA synthase